MPKDYNSEAIAQLQSIGRLDAKPGSVEWAIAIRLEMQSELHDLKFGLHQLKSWIELMKEHGGWKILMSDTKGHKFQSWEEFCRAKPPIGLGLDENKLKRILAIIDED